MTTTTTTTTTTTSPSEPFLTIHNTPVYFKEDWATGIGGGLWSTGLALAKYFDTDASLASIQRLVKDKNGGGGRRLSALELGSGNGLLAVCLAALAGDRYLENLVVTDTKEHLDMIRHTIEANQHILSLSKNNNDHGKNQQQKSSDEKRMNVCVLEHYWGKFEKMDDNHSMTDLSSIDDQMRHGTLKFDLIIGSDVAYREELYDPLIASLQQFSNESTVSLIGVTMVDTTPAFFERLEQAGFSYERFADHLVEPEFRGTTFGIFVIQRRKR